MKSFKKRVSFLLTALVLISVITSPKISLADTKESGEIIQEMPVIVSADHEESYSNNLVISMKDLSSFNKIMQVLPKESIISSFENIHSVSVNMTSLEELHGFIKEQGLSDFVLDTFEDNDVHMHKVPNDEFYDSHQWNLKKINMESAWDYPSTDRKVIVAVVDSGVTAHDDMSNVINGADFSSGRIYEDRYPGEFSYDVGHHGTAVAAGIASEHNAYGIAGINPNVVIMGVKVFQYGSATASSSVIAAAITWATDNGADIINLSLGSDVGNSILESAVRYAESKGVLLVAATGNDGYHNQIDYPAAYNEVLAVGSIDSDDEASYFSNTGGNIDLVAPGVNIYLPNISKGEDSYAYFNGTSFSAPAVAGAAAVLLQAHPDLSNVEIRNFLTMSAKDINFSGWDRGTGYGIVDVYKALVMAENKDMFDERNSFDTAEVIYPNQKYERYIAPHEDNDFYMFILHEPYRVEIKATSSSDLDLVLGLFDEDINQLKNIDDFAEAQGEREIVYLEAGRYFLRVSDYYGKISSSPYSIEINLIDVTNPSLFVYDYDINEIEDEGLSQSSTFIYVYDTSVMEYDVIKDGESLGMVYEVSEEGNYEVIATDAQGNISQSRFVLDYDGYLRVSFDSGTDNIVEDSYTYYNSQVQVPEISRDGYIFKEWYKEPQKINVWAENDVVKRNMTLYSEWEELELERIEVSHTPIKTNYYVDDEIDLAGLKITGHYIDGSTGNIDIDKLTISGFDSSSPIENQRIEISLGSLSTNFFITISPKILESIEITSYPIKNIYVMGQELDLDGLEITGIYNSGAREIIQVNQSMISGFDNTKVQDNQVVAVTIGDKIATFTVDIIAKKLDSINITKEPTDIEYVVGQEIDLTGLEVTGTYNDGLMEVLDIDIVNISGFNSSKPTEDQVITVTVNGKTAVFTVDIVAKALVTIEITKQPADLEYVVGQTLDLTGLVVTGAYNDESTRVLDITIGNVIGFDSSSPEIGQVITINVEGKTAAFSVNIIEKALLFIEITKLPDDLMYVVGQELDLTGLEVTGTYNDESTQKIDITLENIGGFDNSVQEFDQLILITYEGRVLSFTVDVLAKELTSIEITNQPVKLDYVVGQALDLNGLEVAGTYNDETKEVLDITMENISGFNNSIPVEDQVITITVDGMTATFIIDIIEKRLTVIEIIEKPTDLMYVIGQNLDLSGLEVSGTYNDGSIELLDITMENISGFNSSTPEVEQVVTVTVDGIAATFTVDIIAKNLINVTLLNYPIKTTYAMGENFDLTGLILLSEYNDGSSQDIPLSEVEISGFDSSKAATGQTVTLSVLTWKFDVKVDIIGASVEAVEVIAGANRYRTAVAISNASYAQADTVILVQANNFPDALAAGPLAFMMDAPILLTSTASLSSSVKEEIQRLEAKRIIIMGGYSAVSANVEQGLKAEGYTVERLEGSNRYSTAVGTAKYMEEKLGARNTVVMASGNQFADALAAGSYAAKEGYPILLTDGNRLTKATIDHITGSGVDSIILVGGTSVISEALESQLKAMGISITRKSGKNRFDTSLEIARSYFGDSETAVVANGMEFADALAAAPYAAKMNAPIILVNQTRINLPIKEYLPTSKISKIIVVGGDAAVNEAVRNELRQLIR